MREALRKLSESTTRGDPESPLRWTSKSVRQLSRELETAGFRICPQKVADLLHEMGYSLQANRKTLEGANHPDRDAQFCHIQAAVRAYQDAPHTCGVISVDTKKKELVGEFKNNGLQWRRKGEPVAVKVHDFVDPALGRVAPYGIYDLTRNTGWVNVGTDHDTPRVCGREYPVLVESDGPGLLPRGEPVDDYRRWRRQQQCALPIMEV